MAKNLQGIVTRGTLEASSKREVYRLLKERDYYPVKVGKVIQIRDIKDLQLSSKIKSEGYGGALQAVFYHAKGGDPHNKVH